MLSRCGTSELRWKGRNRNGEKRRTRADANAERRKRDEGQRRTYTRAQQPNLSAADGSIHAGEKGAERIGLTALDDLRLALEHVETPWLTYSTDSPAPRHK